MSTLQFQEYFKEAIDSIIWPERSELFSRKSNPNILVVRVPGLGLSIDIEDTFQPYEHENPTEPIFNAYMGKVVHSLTQGAFSKLITDLKVILDGTASYNNHCYHEIERPSNIIGEKATEQELFQICCNAFTTRIDANCNATLHLLQQSEDLSHLHNFEIPIGILLRSLVLDSILILAWAHEETYASAIASESFKKIKTISTSTAQEHELVENWKLYSDYFNVHNLSKKQIDTRIEQAFKNLPNSPNIEEYKAVYDYYSKLDHFSLIPYILPKTVFRRLGTMLMATHLIKHAFCAMVSLHFPDYAQQFQNILEVSIIEGEDGKLKFKNQGEA